MIHEQPEPNLRSRCVLLSASLPDPDRDHFVAPVPDPDELDRAITSVTAAVRAAGGRIVMGGHPSIMSLVGQVAAQYPSDEPGFVIYQASPYQDAMPQETRDLYEHGLAEIHWTPTVNDEVYVPGARGRQCVESLKVMRKAMIEEPRPVAMVVLGGMAGIVEEAELFCRLRPGRPIITVRSVGGAAARLAELSEVVRPRLRVLDQENLPEGTLPPFGVLMEQQLEELAQHLADD